MASQGMPRPSTVPPPLLDEDNQEPRPSRPPISRFSRLAKLTALAPKALPVATELLARARGVERDEEEMQRARERALASAKKTAQAMLNTLGDMKGLPMKFGQMASYIDGLAPPGYEEKFQAVLKRLQAKAPPLSAAAAARVIREDLGDEPSRIFAEWQAEPFAAASIGQVHRAVTRGGERVAVKVQYPGIDKAVENDLKSLSMLEAMIAPIGRRYHTKDTLEEVRRVFLAELDYRREAETAEAFRRIHAEDEDIVIPRVFHSLTTRRVLTCEFIGGQDYQSFAANAPQEDRNLACETIWRFMFRALFRHRLLYADPHPGNYRFLGGKRVAFLDFGCAKVLPSHLVAGMKRYILAAQASDWPAFERACIETLGYDPSDQETYPILIEYTKRISAPLIVDGPYRHTHEAARDAVQFLVQKGRSVVFRAGDPLPNLPKPIHAPADLTFVNRLQWGLLSVLAGLGGEANWRRITDPWLRAPEAE